MENQEILLRILGQSVTATDPREIEEARRYLDQVFENQFEITVIQLSEILSNENCSPIVRMQAGLQLKNVLSSNDSEQKILKQNRWLSMTPESRNAIKLNCLNALRTQEMGHVSASQCVASIACAEIPHNQWPDVIQHLVNNITLQTNPENMKKACLETIGYICNEIDAAILTSQADYILTGIIHGMKENQNHIKLAATNALLNSIEFTRQNFENEQERNYIMQVVCETTQCPDTNIAVVALQCLVKIMSQYYAFMELYMQRALFAITVEAMKNEHEGMQMQGIEFWSTVAEEEIDLALEAEDCTERGVPVTVVNKQYAKGALKYITPLLLTILESQTDTDDYDEWSPHNAAGVCLGLMAQACEDNIITEVLPYVKDNIQSSDWRKRDAAIMAFGSILEGPSVSSLSHIVPQAMPVIIQLLTDQTAVVRDTAAWTVGRICEVIPDVPLMDESLPRLLQAMIQTLPGEARVATNVCWAFASLADAAYQVESRQLNNSITNTEGDVRAERSKEPTTYKLSPFFTEVVHQLIATTERQDCAHTNLRNAAYSALMEVMRSAPKDCYACILQTTELVIRKLQSILQLEQNNLSSSDRQQLDEYQSLLCGTLQSVLRKIDKCDALKISDQVMTVLMTMFHRVHAAVNLADGSVSNSNKYTGVQEDALLAVGALIDAIDSDFSKYLPAFMEVLQTCLQNPNEVQVCSNAIGILGDLSRNIGSDLSIYLDPIFALLDQTLRKPGTHKSLLPQIITTFGDFALQLGDNFIKYRPTVLETLKQACQAEVDMNDPDMIDYLNQLRHSVMDTYVGLIQGARPENPTDSVKALSFIIPELNFIVSFIEHITLEPMSNDELIGSSCGFIGDIAEVFGIDCLQLLDREVVQNLLLRGRNSRNGVTKRYALWATKSIKKIKSQINIAQQQIISVQQAQPQQQAQ